MSEFSFLSGQAGNVNDEADRYPILQWYNGQQAAKSLGKTNPLYTGGFFFKASQDENFPIGEVVEYNFAGGTSEDVFAIGPARIAILASRVEWYLGDKNGKVEWLEHYEQGAKGRNRFLVVLDGAEQWHVDNGPLMISIYGVNGLMMSRAYTEFQQTVHKTAEKIAGQRLDAYTFYMPIVPGDYERANPNFSTMVTPPKLDLRGFDKKNPQKHLDSLFVGPSMMTLCSSLWSRAQEWRQEPMRTTPKEDGLMPEAFGDPTPTDDQFSIED